MKGLRFRLLVRIVGPKDLPADISAKLQADVAKVLALPDVKQRLEHARASTRSASAANSSRTTSATRWRNTRRSSRTPRSRSNERTTRPHHARDGAGRGRHRHKLRLPPRQGRPRGDRASIASGARRWRRASPMPAASARDLPARGRRPACREGRALAVRASCADHAASAARSRSMAMALPASCATARRSASPATRRACSASPTTARRASRTLRAETGIAFDHGTGGRAAGFSHRRGARRGAERRPRARRVRRSASARRRPAKRWRSSRRCAPRPSSWRAACICPMTRPATATSSPSRSPSFCANAASYFQFNTNVQRLLFEGDRVDRCRHQPRHARCGCLRRRARQRGAVACCGRSESISRSIRSRDTRSPSTSIESTPAPRSSRHGRAFQGHDHPARQPPRAAGRSGRDRRLRYVDPSVRSGNRAAAACEELFSRARRAVATPVRRASTRGRGCVQ